MRSFSIYGYAKYLLSACCFLIAESLPGQDYSYVQYGLKDGLAGSVVYTMVQDRDGFIWFGTESGLSRFDGSRFANFTNEDGLPDNEVLKLFLDSKDRLWIISFANKICYYRKGKIYHEGNDSLLKKLAIRSDVIAIAENKKEQVAIYEKDRISIINQDNSINRVKGLDTRYAVVKGGLDLDSSFLFGSQVNFKLVIHKINGNYTILHDSTRYYYKTDNSANLDPRVRIMLQEGGILRITTSRAQFKIKAPEGLLNINVLNDSLLAVTSSTRTFIYNYCRDKIEGEFFNGQKISCVLRDKEDNLWFGSLGGGIFRLSSTGFRTWRRGESSEPFNIYCLEKNGNWLFAGADNNMLWQLNTVSNSFSAKQLPGPPGKGRVMALKTLPFNRLLIGTDEGFFCLDGRIYEPRERLGAVKSLYTSGDSILMGTNRGFFILNNFRAYRQYVTSQRTNAVYKLNDSAYFGTLGGLYAYANGQIQFLGGLHAALTMRISVLEGAADGTLWVGTNGSGVVGYKDGKVTHVLNRDSGLTSNTIRHVFAAGNTLWIGTDRGLNKVDWINGRAAITRYTTSDGLPSDMINTVLADGNKIYVGTPAGLTCFEEDKVFTNSMCVLRLLEIRSGRRRWISDSSAIRFGHYERDIRFEYTGISFKSAGEIEYRYRLKGLDSSWQTTRERFLQYPTLPSGSYVLQLQAVNKFGVTSELISLPFEVAYLLHERTWFRVLLVLAAALGVWWYVSYRVRRIRRQEQLKADTNRKMAELEQMALRAQMNPHFIFNSLNSIQHYVFDKDIEGANRFITAFSRLMRQTLELSTRARISLEEEQHFLQTYLELEKKRFSNKFRYRIEIEQGIEAARYYIPPMMLQPYIENSIRHGIRYREDNKGMVLVRFSKKDGFLECCVEDNGIGRARSKELKGRTSIEYQSRGMTLTARRIEMMNKSFILPIDIDISDINTENRVTGTRVVIRIPLQELTRPTY